MTDREKREFDSIISDIVFNKEFNRLHTELHHGITRYEHSLRVAKYSYLVSKKVKLNNVDKITRAALLHDFYVDEDMIECSEPKKLRIHPKVALDNASKYYELNDMQKDIIRTHMFPVSLKVPKYKESWLVSIVDKVVGTYEMLRFKTPLYASIYILFFMQIFYVRVL